MRPTTLKTGKEPKHSYDPSSHTTIRPSLTHGHGVHKHMHTHDTVA
jgi:hypothetical protein